ncbi:hypothetical protein ABZ935_03040 [Streptomyces coeruleorubidus]|uniref:hypothetical protein n=1 Tax=Streptomyces coeruleorubidus TaxID=116188 RepID=UPI0033FF071C
MINSLKTAARNGSPISVSGIARHAGMDRTFLYRHRDLLALVHAAELEPAGQDGTGAAPVSRISLQADLANAQARNARLVGRVQWSGGSPKRWASRSGASRASVPLPTLTNSSAASRDWNSATSNSSRSWRKSNSQELWMGPSGAVISAAANRAFSRTFEAVLADTARR